MKSLSILTIYFWWHYFKAPPRIFFLTVHFVRTTLHFFSVLTMIKTLLSPWRQLSAERSKKIDFTDIMSSIVVNTIMRIFGALIKLTMIVLALIITALMFVGGLLFLVYWLLMPMIVMFLFIAGPGLIILF